MGGRITLPMMSLYRASKFAIEVLQSLCFMNYYP